MSSQDENSKVESYTLLAKFLHWLAAALIFTQFSLSWQAESAATSGDAAQQLNLLAHHKSIGMTILALMCLRIIWRFKNSPPSLPKSIPTWQQNLVHFSHWLVYVALFITPLSGWLGSSAKAFSVSWFSVFSFPDLIGVNAELGDVLYQVHGAAAFFLFIFVLIHIVAAIKHKFVDKDLVLEKMLSPIWGLFFVVLVVISVYLTQEKQKELSDNIVVEENTLLSSSTGNEVNILPAAESELVEWDIDYALSSTTFSGEQAGAEFEGEFEAWEVSIHFDSENLDESYLIAEFDLTETETGNADRDSQLQAEPFFFVEQFPKAQFVSNTITLLDDMRYRAESSLNLKGLETSVLFYFTVEESDKQIVLLGQAELDRLELMIGTGTWTNTNSIGQTVNVSVEVIARK